MDDAASRPRAGLSRGKGAKVIHGVPVAAYMRQRRHAIAAKPTAPTDGGLRVFLQCMELKSKGPESLDEKGCQELAGRAKEMADFR